MAEDIKKFKKNIYIIIAVVVLVFGLCIFTLQMQINTLDKDTLDMAEIEYSTIQWLQELDETVNNHTDIINQLVEIENNR